jgi:hypothetical protein
MRQGDIRGPCNLHARAKCSPIFVTISFLTEKFNLGKQLDNTSIVAPSYPSYITAVFRGESELPFNLAFFQLRGSYHCGILGSTSCKVEPSGSFKFPLSQILVLRTVQHIAGAAATRSFS